jgi:tRNA G18 (ribose-2'-O)-methylase SpoU
VVLDNLRSAYNVGSIVRTADGAGIDHLYLCGITPTLDHPKVAKTALGAEATVESSYHPNALTLVSDLQSRGIYLAALESRPGAVSLFDPVLRIPTSPAVLVVGNELVGVDPAIEELCDLVVALPMMGTKRSLNVVVAFGIASYWLRFGMTHIST